MFKFTKYICILSILAAPFVFNQNAALAGGNFTASCKNIQFTLFTMQGGFSPLGADCNTITGEIRSRSFNFVDLNAHITNNDGTLAWQKDGGFANSVDNCDLGVSNVTILFCDAKQGDGSVVNSSIVLDEKIENVDGNLTVNDFQVDDFQVVLDKNAALIYDQTDPDTEKVGKQAKNGRGITSVNEAVTAAKDVAGGGKLETLILAGHGASGTIGLGSGTDDEYQKGKELRVDKLDDVSDDLENLKKSLAKDSYVILSGCETGKGDDGLKFIKQVSEKLSGSYIFANTKCIGLTADPTFRKTSVCTAEGNKQWQKSSIVAAKENEQVDVDRDLYKKLVPRLCVSK